MIFIVCSFAYLLFSLQPDVGKIVGMETAIVDTTAATEEDQEGPEDENPEEDILEDDRAEENNSMPSEPFEADDRKFVCRRTSLPFPSSSVLKLLTSYDDQVRTALPPYPTEQVFCRICREGLHDDAEELPAAAGDEADIAQAGEKPTETLPEEEEEIGSTDFSDKHDQGPVIPHPTYTPHTELMNNPMLAPCECSGSMAFVHFLCVEQWRCRSRHPAAMNGLNCETCKAPYRLPPPADRPQATVEDEWQNAMPAHVMQALRQPHLWWQIGAAVVRRRWLRPLAPIVMSPMVALYCRARRLLKKRGVARRRWACSLCRRRARWKCVRCLRSYYCSRQCQNVSWHIIHKHVCYKPSRLYQSIVFYSLAAVTLFPGSLRDPVVYSIGLALVPVSFVIMGILGGGAATLLKKLAGIDLRGRRMELMVLLATIGLSLLSWGLLRAFFGDTSACYGVAGQYSVTHDDLSSTILLRSLHWGVFTPAEFISRALDSKLARSFKWMRFCLNGDNENACLEHLGKADSSFFLLENEDATKEQCASDLLLIGSLYIAAVCSYVGSTALKQHEREQRRRRHLHQE